MLRYVLRRALWAIPTLFGVSLVVFLVTTLLPDPAGENADETLSLLQLDPERFAILDEKRREHFLDLPRFFNARPEDVRTKTSDALAHLVAGDELAPLAAYHLGRTGGAALPYVLPKLDNLPPAARGRVAVALAPIGERIGMGEPEVLRDPEQAALFWQRFWEDRALDFTDPAVRRSVSRLSRRATDLRERDLVLVDTFVLAEAIPAMETTTDKESLARVMSLAAHATGRGMEIAPNASDAEIARAVADWRSWWFVHETDYTTLDGAERIAASITETRYGKWMLGAAAGQLGLSTRDGQPITTKLAARAPLTLTLVVLAMVASFSIAVPLGAFSAWRRRKPVDTTLAVVLFALYSLPTFLAAQLLARITGGAHLSIVAPVLALAAGSLATLSRYQRAAMLDVIGQDYIRTARAKGVSTFRVVVVHALRNALLPTVTLAGLQFPALLGGAFVVEEIFGLPGVGYETLRAVEVHDTPWLIVVVLLSAIVTTAAILTSDVAYGLFDPRMREALGQRRGQP
jgi:ABC-type dipeptide/oligopeptide/nickel transport system permease component